MKIENIIDCFPLSPCNKTSLCIHLQPLQNSNLQAYLQSLQYIARKFLNLQYTNL